MRGRAVQVDPIKPTVEAAGSKRLKLEHGRLLSNVGFNFHLRRYSLGLTIETRPDYCLSPHLRQMLNYGQGLTVVPISAQLELFCPPYNLN